MLYRYLDLLIQPTLFSAETHNIENELIFQSNDKPAFHDSQGFEAGSEGEFLRMHKFIEDCAKMITFNNAFARYGKCIVVY
jgi:hypothetical protein